VPILPDINYLSGLTILDPLHISISELAPTAMRGRCVGVNAFFIPFGQLCASAISIPFKDVKHNWRILCENR
jgi:SP family myo-inositol transporter-like MFS transporter 13